jgi:hypothetical protein
MGAIIREISIRASRAQKRNTDFVVTTYTGRTNFLVRCSVTEIGLPSSDFFFIIPVYLQSVQVHSVNWLKEVDECLGEGRSLAEVRFQDNFVTLKREL